MRLQELLRQVVYHVIRGTEETEVRSIRSDSRLVEEGDVFVCISGYETDGHRFLPEAVGRGAAAVIVQKECPRRGCQACRCYRNDREVPGSGLTVVEVSDTRFALAMMAAAYYRYPARELTVIGVTGTKGKTTTSYMIRQGLQAAGRRTGLMGTVQVDTGKRVFRCGNTTPDALEIQEYLREMADAGCDSAVMEVSSQALKLHRTAGIEFAAGVFLNLGRDHIGPGEHADMEEYLQCKRRLFFQCRTAVGNSDDSCLEAVWRGTSCKKITWGIRSPERVNEAFLPDYYAGDIQCTDEGGRLGSLCLIGGRMPGKLRLTMPGKFNVSNALGAAAVLSHLRVPAPVILGALEEVQVPGRMEAVGTFADCRILVDYAHNAMSLRRCLETLREYQPKRLTVLFGCGGNRSRERRFSMGETAGTYADFTILTTDNPRFEAPEAILRDIEEGIRKTAGRYLVIPDREEAVRFAVNARRPGEIILIAGKGHETYQEIRGVRYPMDDRELVRKCTQTLL